VSNGTIIAGFFYSYTRFQKADSMHTGHHYTIQEFIYWTRRDIYIALLIAGIPTACFQLLGWTWLVIPWVPIAMIGTAAAFIVGFKNTQTYNRLWEARQIYGSIVNSSRTWGMLVRDYTGGTISGEAAENIHRELIYRHIAWLTVLRFQLREKRTWENTDKSYNKEYRKHFRVPEWESSREDELKSFLSEEEIREVLKKKNPAAQLIAKQSRRLKELHDAGIIDTFRFVELEQCLSALIEHQGKCERIKNFPYPRQFSSINLFFIWLFVLLVPFGILNEFSKIGDLYSWLTIPFSVVVSWVFTSLEKIGESTENPFEGSPNDVPITSMSRGIEIDLREMLGETELPEALPSVNKILM
jgi:ion channel-forming bestrophin family protein